MKVITPVILDFSDAYWEELREKFRQAASITKDDRGCYTIEIKALSLTIRQEQPQGVAWDFRTEAMHFGYHASSDPGKILGYALDHYRYRILSLHAQEIWDAPETKKNLVQPGECQPL